jgi:site-specific DNA-methyltransferase (adenine-specific)
MIKLIHGDCLEKMAEIEDGSVDMVLADPPYGTTACKWDSIIPLEPMWAHLKRVIKPNGAIVICGSEPFSSILRCSNLKMFRCDWVWDKKKAANFAQSGFQPMKYHEMISVFYSKKPTYNPQKTDGKAVKKTSSKHQNKERREAGLDMPVKYSEGYEPSKRLPRSIIEISKPGGKFIHPTQKPVALMEYLIKTYTNEGETVLDFTMGSGTTGVACVNLNRSFIGIEKDAEYFQLATDRIHSHNTKHTQH